MKCDTATVCRAPVVNASKETTVICATTHCATLDKAILPANKQLVVKSWQDLPGHFCCFFARSAPQIKVSSLIYMLNLSYSLLNPIFHIKMISATKFDFPSEPYLKKRGKNEFQDLFGSRFFHLENGNLQ